MQINIFVRFGCTVKSLRRIIGQRVIFRFSADNEQKPFNWPIQIIKLILYFIQNLKEYCINSIVELSIGLDPWVDSWISVSGVGRWVSIDRAFAVTPWDVTEKSLFTTFGGSQWSTRVTHAGGDTIGGGTLLSGSESLESPDLLTFFGGDAVDVHPLESGSDDTWVTTNMLRVSVSRWLTWVVVWQFRFGWTDNFDWCDVFVEGPWSFNGQDHVIVINLGSIVLWMWQLCGTILLLCLCGDVNRTGTSCPVVLRLFAVSSTHYLWKILESHLKVIIAYLVSADDGTTAVVGSWWSLEGDLMRELTVNSILTTNDDWGWGSECRSN